MDSAASQAITESIHRNLTVHLPYSPRVVEYLTADCEDSAETEDELQFWGEREDSLGNVSEWRVHVDRPGEGEGEPVCEVFFRDLTTNEVHKMPIRGVYRLEPDGNAFSFFGDSSDSSLLSPGTHCEVLCERNGDFWPSIVINEIEVGEWIEVESDKFVARGIEAITVARRR